MVDQRCHCTLLPLPLALASNRGSRSVGRQPICSASDSSQSRAEQSRAQGEGEQRVLSCKQ